MAIRLEQDESNGTLGAGARAGAGLIRALAAGAGFHQRRKNPRLLFGPYL